MPDSKMLDINRNEPKSTNSKSFILPSSLNIKPPLSNQISQCQTALTCYLKTPKTALMLTMSYQSKITMLRLTQTKGTNQIKPVSQLRKIKT